MAHLARNPALYAKPIGMAGTGKPPGVSDAKFPSQWWGFNWFGQQVDNGLRMTTEFDAAPQFNEMEMRYLAWHYEQNGENGRVHQSGVVYFHNRVHAAQAKILTYGMGNAKTAQFYALRAHTDTQAFVDYHIKEEQRVADPNTGEADVYIYGERPQYRVPNGMAAPAAPSAAAVQRNVMTALARDITIPLAVIAEMHPDDAVKFDKEIRIARRLAIEGMDTNPVENLQVFVFYGDAGAGKSTSVEYNYRKYFGHLGQFHLSTSRSGEMWWDMYDGEGCIVLDDYDGTFRLDDFKTLVSEMCSKRRWQVKGGHTRAKPQVIFITSNKHPVAWYPNATEADQHAVLRRCRHCVAMTGELDARGIKKRGPDGKPIPQVYDVVLGKFIGGIEHYKKIVAETNVSKAEFFRLMKEKAKIAPVPPAVAYMSPAREDKALAPPAAPVRKMPVAPKLSDEKDDELEDEYRGWLKPRKLFHSRVFPPHLEDEEEVRPAKKKAEVIEISDDEEDDCVVTDANIIVISDDEEDTEGESIGSKDSVTDTEEIDEYDDEWLDSELTEAMDTMRNKEVLAMMKKISEQTERGLRMVQDYKDLVNKKK